MEIIYQGIGFSLSVTNGTGEPILSQDIIVALRNPATDYSVAFLATPGTESELICTITSADTALMPVGNYNLEIYDYDKTEMLRFVENYAVVKPSSANGKEFIKVPYIMVNGAKYERQSLADFSIDYLIEKGFVGRYAWETADTGATFSIVRTRNAIPSVGENVYFVAGDTVETIYASVNEYVPSNI